MSTPGGALWRSRGPSDVCEARTLRLRGLVEAVLGGRRKWNLAAWWLRRRAFCNGTCVAAGQAMAGERRENGLLSEAERGRG